MDHQFLSLDELAQQLGRDRREVERQVQRGIIPGHRMEGGWRFHPAEIRHWLEQEMRGFSADELASVESAQNLPAVTDQSLLQSVLAPELVAVPLDARTKRSVIESLIEVAGRTWQVWEPAVVLEAVLEREAALSTAFENGVAIPHPRNPLPTALGASLVAFGRTSSGIPFGGPRRSLTDLFFLVLCQDARTHLAVLARLGRLLRVEGFVDQLRECPDSLSAHELLIATDRQVEA